VTKSSRAIALSSPAIHLRSVCIGGSFGFAAENVMRGNHEIAQIEMRETRFSQTDRSERSSFSDDIPEPC
jgi:hypothetical protein